MDYSVVLPVYAGDDANWFAQAAQSALGQTLEPDEIVVVTDGPLPPALAQAVKRFTAANPQARVVEHQRNLGAGPARNSGIEAARTEIVAVQDADDISLPQRMELLAAALGADPGLALVGGQLAEFTGNDPDHITSERRVPVSPDAVRRFARRRMPVNGPTVMFRKSAVQAVGGYGAGTRSEDYLLVARLLAAQERVANIPEVVLLYRGGDEAISRRRTWGHLRGFVSTRLEVRRLGLARWRDVLIPCAAQLAMTITPPFVTKLLYAKVLRRD